MAKTLYFHKNSYVILAYNCSNCPEKGVINTNFGLIYSKNVD